MTRQHWESWLWTCVYALLPLILSVAIATARERPIDANGTAREIFFFALTLFTLSLSELRSMDRRGRNSRRSESLTHASTICAIVTAGVIGNDIDSPHGIHGSHILVAPLFAASVALLIGALTRHSCTNGETDGPGA